MLGFRCVRPMKLLVAREKKTLVPGVVLVVTRAKSFAARGFGRRPKICRPVTDTEASRHTRKKPSGPQGKK